MRRSRSSPTSAADVSAGRRPARGVVLATASGAVTLHLAALPIPLPAMMRDLEASVDEITWVIAAFVFSFAALLLPIRRLVERHGSRRSLLGGASVLVVASAGGALAPTISLLLGAQALLGAGAALTESAVRAVALGEPTAARRRRAVGLQTLGVFLGAALGPVVSGALTTWGTWRVVFWLTALLGAAVALGVGLVTPERSGPSLTPPPDIGRAVTSILAVGAVSTVLIEGARLGWRSPMVVGLLVLGGVAAGTFLVLQLRSRDTRPDAMMLRNRRFTVGAVLRGLVEFASLGIFFGLSHLLQVQFGHTALAAGALLMVIVAATVATAPVAERMAGRVDGRWLIVPGFLLVAAGPFPEGIPEEIGDPPAVVAAVGAGLLSCAVAAALGAAGALFLVPATSGSRAPSR